MVSYANKKKMEIGIDSFASAMYGSHTLSRVDAMD